MSTIRRFFTRDPHFMSLGVIFIVVFIFCTALKGPLFLSVGNLQSMGKQFPEFGLLSLAMAITMFTAGIDLSVVAIANLGAVIVAKMILAAAPEMGIGNIILLSFAVTIVIGALCGAFNGFLIGVVGITPILATLGSHALFTGFAIVLTDGSTIGGLPKELSAALNGYVFGIPAPVLIFVVGAAALIYITGHTVLGYRLRMLGTSVKASTFSGLHNVRLFTYNYMISGVLSALAGLIMLGRFNSAKADYGASYLMEAILIAVLGGIDPYGGKGKMKCVVVAILIIQMISSWLNMYESISNFYRQIIWGGLLISVLIYNYVMRARELNRARGK